jgi:predicted RNase H-like HicB family nuclease
MNHTFTILIQKEDDGFVALCPELDIASQGPSIPEARENLKEAVELFFEAADPSEVGRRWNTETYITSLEVTVGKAA